MACVALLLFACGGWSESKYRSVFLSIADVKEVGSFRNYENHRNATLSLTQDRYVHISEFDENIARVVDDIGLNQIGDIAVSCSTSRERTDAVVGAFNIIQAMKSSPLHLQIENIGDLVSHYGEIYRYLEGADWPLQISPKQPTVGIDRYWCFRGSSTLRQRDSK